MFHAAKDYERFLDQLDHALEQDMVMLYAYSLLPNHAHMFIETPHGNVHRFMQRLSTAYSMYHRYKYAEPGHCFQGRYGAKLVSGDAYVTALSRYIHLNPVKTASFRKRSVEQTVGALNRYRWSSYRGYVQAKSVEERIDYCWLELMGCVTPRGNRQRYRWYVEEFVKKTDKAFKAAADASRYAIGDKLFVEQVESDLRDVQENKGVYGDILWPAGKRLAMDTVASVVAQAFGLEPDALQTRSYAARMSKKVALDLCCRYCGESQRTVGEYFGYRGNGSVSKQRQRLAELRQADKGLQMTLRKLQNALESA